ncbi:MAG: exosortase-associated EpsI family protein [Pirellulales bacterium]|nr:exosortase-associated EpsI family protein [Pirellulales bacterium]
MNNDRSPWQLRTSGGIVACAAGVAIVLATGAVYGHFSNRWGTPADLSAAGAHLKSLPAQLGDWRLQEESEISPSTVKMLQCAGYVNRNYVNVQTGDAVSLAIIVGPPGPTAVHTPEICYSSRNFTLTGDREKTRIASQTGDAHTAWKTSFESKSAFGDRLHVYYAWSDGGRWSASNSPRFEFAASPRLFKLQLAGLVGTAEQSPQDDPPAQFFKALVNSNWSLAAP